MFCISPCEAVVSSKGSKTECTRSRALERGGIPALQAWASRAHLYDNKGEHQKDEKAPKGAGGAAAAANSDDGSSTSDSSQSSTGASSS